MGSTTNPTRYLSKAAWTLFRVPFSRLHWRGVLFSAIGVLVFQGALTLGFVMLGQEMEPLLVDELTALGGILMLGIGLQLLGIRPKGLANWPVVDALPAFVILPLVRIGHEWIAG